MKVVMDFFMGKTFLFCGTLLCHLLLPHTIGSFYYSGDDPKIKLIFYLLFCTVNNTKRITIAA
jgi:hypothetical protein